MNKMDLIRQLMVKHDTPKKREIYKDSVECADSILQLLTSVPIAELNDADKKALFSDIYDIARGAGLNNKFKRSLIDVI